MSFIVGTGTNLQVGKESTFAAVDERQMPSTVMTENVNLTSEALKVSVEKGDEGSLLASKTATARDLMAINVDGNISFILKPDFAGRIIQAAMGGTDAVTAAGSEAQGYHKHTMNLCDPKTDLPSLAFTIDRGTGPKAYIGCTIGSLSIDAAAGDYVKGSIDIKGTEEKVGKPAIIKAGEDPSYRCTEATFMVGDQKYCISSASFKLDNALEESPKTYCTGLYKGQPQHGKRNVTIDFDIPYSKDIDTLKTTNLVTEVTTKIVLKFTSRDPKQFIEITMPNVSINDITANVGGPGVVNASVSGEALSKGAVEPVTIVIQDKNQKAY